MPILLKCAACTKTLQVNEAFAGKKVKCPLCGAILTAPPANPVPVAVTAVPAPAPPPVRAAPPPLPPQAINEARAADIPEEARGLGELHGAYGFARWIFVLSWAVGAVSVLVGCAVPFLFLLFPPTNPVRGTTTSLPVAIGVGSGFALLGVVLILYARYLNTCRILLFQGGFAYLHGRKCRVVRWQDVTTYWDYLRTFRVELKDGQSLKVSVRYSTKPVEIREKVEDQISAVLFPEALRRFRAGAPLQFGPFTLSRDGLVYNGTLLPFGELKNISLNYNLDLNTRSLEIMREGAHGVFWSVSTPKIPNLRLMLRLVQDARPGLG